MRLIRRALCAVSLCCITAWAALAIHFVGPGSAGVRNALALAYAGISVAALAAFLRPGWRRTALALHALLFAIVLLGWLALEPSNERPWRAEYSLLPYATLDGDRVTVHNIRDFDYRTESDFTPRYYDRAFDMRELQSVDLVVSYWMGPHIAHVFLTFGFGNGTHLAISIEGRRERGEAYSALQAFFRRYELAYVVGDERDVIRVRTNYRRDPPEDVYLYPLRGSSETGRQLFLWYVDRINALRGRPEFYNALTTNCTSDIWLHSGVVGENLPLSWKLIANGHLPELLYDIGRLDRTVSFEELRRRGRINGRALAADRAADFSRRIRQPEGAG